ncbi:hypothetical protein [Methylotetracoccus oryzae]|nr:hypothetical protein [Methylotetracoccus oryzae]
MHRLTLSTKPWQPAFVPRVEFGSDAVRSIPFRFCHGRIRRS